MKTKSGQMKRNQRPFQGNVCSALGWGKYETSKQGRH